jgi:hypothetical protein
MIADYDNTFSLRLNRLGGCYNTPAEEEVQHRKRALVKDR